MKDKGKRHTESRRPISLLNVVIANWLIGSLPFRLIPNQTGYVKDVLINKSRRLHVTYYIINTLLLKYLLATFDIQKAFDSFF